MKPTTREGAEGYAAVLRNPADALIAFDFDGTLAPIVDDPAQVDEAQLKGLGSSGVIKRGKIVQVVMGTQSDRIAGRIKLLMKGSDADSAEEQANVQAEE